MRNQKKNSSLRWHVYPSVITKDNRFISSVVYEYYEDYYTDNLCLNFFTASLDRKPEDEIPRDYPQQPVR